MTDELSAEELAERELAFLRLAARVDPNLRKSVENVEAYIEAQAREMALYRKALEKIWLGDHLSDWAREVADEALSPKGIPK